jgi:subtilisin
MTQPATLSVIRFAHMSPGETVNVRRLAQPASIDRHWAWGGSTGVGTRVCVIDSGLDPAAEIGRRGGSFRVAKHDVEGDLSYDILPDSHGDAASHGTACATIIHRLAPDCEITSVRVLGPSLGGSSDVLVAALRWAIGQDFGVINLSLSTKNPVYKQEIHDLVDRALFANIAIVAAAHNNPVDSFPWRFSAVFSTGSHAVDDPEYIELNPRPPVEYFAAGVRVAIPQNGGTVRMSGNSFAAPHLAGLIARIRSKHPHLTVPEIKHVLAAIAGNLVEGEQA